MFASKTVGQIAIKDGDTEVTVKFRKLSRRQLFAASEAQSDRAAKAMNRMSPEVLKGIHEAGQAEIKRREAEQKTLGEKSEKKPAEINYDGYDVETVLLCGVISWAGPNATANTPADVKAGIEEMTEAASKKLHRAILDISIEKEDTTPKG